MMTLQGVVMFLFVATGAIQTFLPLDRKLGAIGQMDCIIKRFVAYDCFWLRKRSFLQVLGLAWKVALTKRKKETRDTEIWP